MPRKKKVSKEPEEKEILEVGVKNKYNLNFNKFKLTEKQNEFMKIAFDKNTKMVFVLGPAGTSKTWSGVYAALQLFNMMHEHEIIYVRTIAESGEKGLGSLPGPQPLYSKVLTRNGWVKMGDLKIGDKILAWDGTESNVIGVYDQGIKPVFEVTTNDQKKTRCCEDHLWFTTTLSDKKNNKKGSVKSLKEISNSLKGSPENKKLSKRLNHFLPQIKAMDFPEKELPIPPYTLGALLGDGSFSNSISFCSSDSEIIKRVGEEVQSLNCQVGKKQRRGENFQAFSILSNEYDNNKVSALVRAFDTKTGKEMIFRTFGDCLKHYPTLKRSSLGSKCSSGAPWEGIVFEKIKPKIKYTNKIKEEIFKLGLLGKNHLLKFIPEIYKKGSVQQRIDLIRGLMDTDGCCKENNGSAAFYNTSLKLCEGLQDIVRSLGGKCVITKRDRTKEKPRFCEKIGRAIKGNYPCYTCYVTLPNELNPFWLKRKRDRFYSNFFQGSKVEQIDYIEDTEVRCIKIDHPDHLYITDDYIVTHNTEIEKLSPFLSPLMDKVEEIVNSTSSKMLMNENIITGVPVNYLRGASWKNKIVICDESQNYSHKELVTTITRIGENTKFFVCGDPMQSDINGKSGLLPICELFDNEESKKKGIHVFRFEKEDIMRSEILKFIIGKLESLKTTK